MLSKYSLFIFGCALSLLCSCSSTKNLIYLQDNGPQEKYSNEQLLKTVQLQQRKYRLMPQDRLLVNIFSLTDAKVNFLSKPEVEVTVNENGSIFLPVIGPFQVSGLTIKETEEKLVGVVSEYLKSPTISIKLLSFNITVLGEVNKQGSFTVAEPAITILAALGTAGGVTENANLKNVRVIRNEHDSARIFQVNILNDNLISSDNYFLQPNDIILVNPSKAKASNQQKATLIGLGFSILSSLAWIFTKFL